MTSFENCGFGQNNVREGDEGGRCGDAASSWSNGATMSPTKRGRRSNGLMKHGRWWLEIDMGGKAMAWNNGERKRKVGRFYVGCDTSQGRSISEVGVTGGSCRRWRWAEREKRGCGHILGSVATGDGENEGDM
ncbi:hypothetical protein HAX54_048838 [Datura stramonium]|uniref:Uncharacterized protein n=1 Tax=Datura stramonium TaxID=4076 RepID=A0ABS8WM51_DATST|nr:hypothetical protein [Datura stramonium]